MAQDYLELIAKLLAQAEGAGTAEEKAVFTAKAQQLATSNSIDLARARYVNVKKQTTTPEQRSIVIGVPGTEGLRTLVSLYSGVAAANDLKCLYAHNSTRVYAHGFPEDIDVSQAMYASLLTQMTDLVQQYKDEGSWRELEVYTEVWRNGFRDGAYRKINWRTARLEFQNGFASRIAHRLYDAKRDAEMQRLAEERERATQKMYDPRYIAGVSREDDFMSDAEWFEKMGPVREAGDTTNPGTALVLAQKHEQVDKFYQSKLPKRVGTYGGGNSNVRASAARRAGVAAANRANIGSRTAFSGQRKGIGR